MIPKMFLTRLTRAEARLVPPVLALNPWQRRAEYWCLHAFGEEGLEALMPLIRGGSWATVASWAYRCTSGVPPRAMEDELCRAENHWMAHTREVSRPLTDYVRSWLETPAGQQRYIDEAYAWRYLFDGTLSHTQQGTQQALTLAWQQATGAEPDEADWWRAVAVLAYGREGGWTPQDPPLRTTVCAIGDTGCDVIREWLRWATNEGCAARYAPKPPPEAPTPAERWAEELTQVLAQWEQEEGEE